MMFQWGCSVELSDLIIQHDPLLADLAMIVYTKSKLPNKVSLISEVQLKLPKPPIVGQKKNVNSGLLF